MHDFLKKSRKEFKNKPVCRFFIIIPRGISESINRRMSDEVYGRFSTGVLAEISEGIYREMFGWSFRYMFVKNIEEFLKQSRIAGEFAEDYFNCYQISVWIPFNFYRNFRSIQRNIFRRDRGELSERNPGRISGKIKSWKLFQNNPKRDSWRHPRKIFWRWSY